jgi:hypothetical protein
MLAEGKFLLLGSACEDVAPTCVDGPHELGIRAKCESCAATRRSGKIDRKQLQKLPEQYEGATEPHRVRTGIQNQFKDDSGLRIQKLRKYYVVNYLRKTESLCETERARARPACTLKCRTCLSTS